MAAPRLGGVQTYTMNVHNVHKAPPFNSLVSPPCQVRRAT
jgi:hypothetical protein